MCFGECIFAFHFPTLRAPQLNFRDRDRLLPTTPLDVVGHMAHACRKGCRATSNVQTLVVLWTSPQTPGHLCISHLSWLGPHHHHLLTKTPIESLYCRCTHATEAQVHQRSSDHAVGCQPSLPSSGSARSSNCKAPMDAPDAPSKSTSIPGRVAPLQLWGYIPRPDPHY